jgi:hypothetical protein
VQKITLLSSLALLCSLQSLPVYAEPSETGGAPVASASPLPAEESAAAESTPSAEATATPVPSSASALPVLVLPPAPEGELPLQLRFEDHQKPDETGRIRTKDSHLLVGGLTRPGAEIQIGDKIVAANEEGQFQLRIPLKDGVQTLTVTGTHESGDQVTRTFEIECKLPPDWFVVAIGDLETGAFNLGGNLQAIAQNDNFPPGLYVDGRVAYYLKGKILGKYLLTSAFDSARQFQPKALSAVDPNRFYPIYGDSSTLVRDAQATGKLYLRLEMLPPDDPKAPRNFSNLLLGDYSAGLAGDTVNLGQYNRTFYGLRTLIEAERKPKEKPLFSATLFAAPVRTIPVRDELRATGISSYRLSVTQTRYLPDASSNTAAPVGTNPDNPTQVNLNNPNQVRQPFVVEGTEQVSIIVRDKNQPDRIVSTRLLERGIDYNLDPFFGSLTLKQPIGTFDTNGNVNYLVVNYEYTNDPFYGVNPFQANSLQGLWNSFSSAFDDTMQRNAFGGRLETTLFDQALTLGANYVQENKAPHNARLISADTRWLWNDRLRLSGEYAFSQVDVLAGLGSIGADALNSLNGFVSNDGGNTWSAVSPALNGQQNIGHAFRIELDAQPFDWTTVRLFMRQTDPLFATLFGGGEPGVRRWGTNIEQQMSEHFSLLGDFIQTDSLPRPVIPGVQDLGQLQLFGNNTLASVGVHWQSVPIEKDQTLPNAPGGDISFRQQQSISNPLSQEKLRVGGGNPAMSQESAKKLAEKTMNADSTTETLPSDYDKSKDPQPEKPKENPLNNVGSMFADLRAELSRSDSGTNALQNARLRGSFNFVPFEKLLGNLRAAVSNNQFSDTSDSARSRNEFSGELGLGATYALDKSISLFTRLDMFHIGSAIYQPTTTASLGLTGSVLETEDISLQPYAQYGINSAIDARNNMISLGLNNRWKITPWLTNNLMIEQSFNVNESFKGLPTQLANATSGSVGFEFLPTKEFKSSLKYELRRQVGAGGMAPSVNPVTGQTNFNGAVPGGVGSVLLDPTLNPQLNPNLVPGLGNNATPLPQPMSEELWQQTGTLAMNGKVGDLSLFGLYLFNQFHSPQQLRSRDLHLRTGAAFRPIGNDVFNIVAMHEFRHVSQPNLFNLSLVEIPLELQADSQVFSLEGIWQILSNVEFSQKYAVKFTTSTVLDTSYRNPNDRSLDKTITNPEPVTTDLIISRLAYRPFYTFEFWDKFDVAGEFRIMRQWPDSIFNAKTGFLTELGYLVSQDVRLGVGYNFTGFNDVTANTNNYQAGNWFVRVTGKY